ncbi:hypothetical protein ACI01nite_22280 [Acetobacter cibinongensis]|uniref:Uncharacterized protein n=1 Tax=Acetobacter cibinongensis TaxID=146475 RepID=A0A0D6N6B7_9PROT|nr:hypothetical protein Abci_025_049 [Acetobacter cibinongensis]GEL59626.1 hypothetical protein ACI01nite_22280 [Acetobacter cibinongensis]
MAAKTKNKIIDCTTKTFYLNRSDKIKNIKYERKFVLTYLLRNQHDEGQTHEICFGKALYKTV